MEDKKALGARQRKRSKPAAPATVSYIGPPELGLPRLPFDNRDMQRTARMLVLEVVALVAFHRKRAESGEAETEQLALLIDCCADDAKLLDYMADFQKRIGRDWDVVNARYWLRDMPRIVPGLDLSLANIEARLVDAEIRLAVDTWCRPARRPRKNEPELTRKWEHLAVTFARIGLGRVAPTALQRDWLKWSSSRPR